MRRIQSAERDLKRKPKDPEMARRNQLGAKPLAGTSQPHLLELDVTAMSPEQATQATADWCRTI